MNNTYYELIDQSFYFPKDEFRVNENQLYFHDIDLMKLIREHGSPLKLTYLPSIDIQIKNAKEWFNQAIDELGYQGRYYYCYCTKSSHFSFVIRQALKNKVHLETSSAYDISLIQKLFENKWVDKSVYVICNGFKTEEYARKISELINAGFTNVIPVLDNLQEIDYYQEMVIGHCNLGIRIASEEEPNFEFYTSRLGVRYRDIVSLHREKIINNPRFTFKMLHFFINTGIKDTAYYWSELNKCLEVYQELSPLAPGLDTINIGGGFPIKNSLGFEYDFAYMAREIVNQIKSACVNSRMKEPDIFTEFGKHTVGGSGAILFTVLQEKLQNDRERWYMINNSIMTTMPDAWSINERFVLLPVNKWNKPYQPANIGGLSCDQYDYYNSEVHVNQVYMPELEPGGEPLHIGFFNTGAYQDALSGFGGTKHCLIPLPKHLILDRDENGELKVELFAEKQSADSMLSLLGY